MLALVAALFLSGCAGSLKAELSESKAELERCNEDYRSLQAQQPATFTVPAAPAQPEGFDTAKVMRKITAPDLEAVLEELAISYRQIDDEKYLLQFRDVKYVLRNKGSSLMLYAGFEMRAQLPRINAWNQRFRFSRAYVDTDGDIALESDLDLEGGVTHATVREFVKTFVISVNAFMQFMGN